MPATTQAGVEAKLSVELDVGVAVAVVAVNVATSDSWFTALIPEPLEVMLEPELVITEMLPGS